MTPDPMISVLTVNYHSSAEVAGLATSLIRNPAAQPVELIVTNNSPADPVPADIGFGLSVVVQDADNLGYAAGINLAYRRSRGQHLMIANPDVRVLPGTLDAACGVLADCPDIGVVLPLLRYPDGGVQRSVRRFYTWPVALYARSPLRGLIRPPRFWRRYLYADLPMTGPTEVDWGLGAAMFLRRADCGPDGVFDPRYFMYFEDVDLCHEAWRRGQRVVYFPNIVCAHAHRRHSANPLSRAGWRHLNSLLRFILKHRGLPPRPQPPRGARDSATPPVV
jgi:hypothetical protein